MADARYFREQAERFARVAEQCSIPSLAPYYQKMALDYLAEAMRAEATDEPAAKPARRRKRAARRQSVSAG
jgi:hypothetical protein